VDMMNPMLGMSGGMMLMMALCMGVGLALGLALLAGTFYLIWRLVRAIEKRTDAQPRP